MAKPNFKKAPIPTQARPAPQRQMMTIDDAFGAAIAQWNAGNAAEAAGICQQILGARPEHQGAKHLHLAMKHGVKHLAFTATALHSPDMFDIGDYSYGVPSVFPHNQPHEPARLSIGAYCTIGHRVEVILGSYHRQDYYTIYPFSAPHFGTLFSLPEAIPDYSSTRGGVRIGNDVWIGAGAEILAGVTIGDGAVIGAGSVVSRDVGSYEIWAGNPAQFRRRRFDEDVASRLLKLRWWDWPKELVQANARHIMSGTAEALQKMEEAGRALFEAERAKVVTPLELVAGYSGAVQVRRSASWETGRKTWVVLHGSLGQIDTVRGIEGHLPDANLLFVDLPGCGGSMAPPEMSVAAYARELQPVLDALLPHEFGMVGVSFGGSVALAVARDNARCDKLVLVDTPFSAAKLWHNHAFLRTVIANRPDDRLLRRFALEIYGVTPTAAVERDYWHLLDGVKASITVVTGTVPIEPARAMPPVPCCLDEQDLDRLRAAGAQVHRIAGGHDLINENPVALAGIIRQA